MSMFVKKEIKLQIYKEEQDICREKKQEIINTYRTLMNINNPDYKHLHK